MPNPSDFEEINFDQEMSTRRWFIELGASVSQFFNVLIFRGDSNYTISSDSYRLNRRIKPFVDWLFSRAERNHCKMSYYYDLTKARQFIYQHELGNKGTKGEP